MWSAYPALAVGEGVVWLAPGTRYAIGNDLLGDWEYEFRTLVRPQLRITPPGAAFSIFLFRDGWYVNLEEPQRATQLGFDYEDELLDVWIPFSGEPELLDEDELDEAVARGYFSPERAAEIHAKAARVLADPPWPTGWESWHPEAGWQVPDLPPGWDVLG